ncbi:MAG: phosphatidylglycerophosphatase A family protein [Bacillota bacterium]
MQKFSKADIKKFTIQWLEKRGVKLSDIADLVLEIQKEYVSNLAYQDCLESVEKVLEKREVQNAVFTGLTLDELAEKGLISEPLLTMLQTDDGLYGIDEVLALSVVNIYGSIGLTNFGYLDKIKLGIVGVCNAKKGECVNTFLDDIIASVAAAAAARIAHRLRDAEEEACLLETAATIEGVK